MSTGSDRAVSRALGALWRLYDGHALTCACSKCATKGAVIDGVVAATGKASAAAEKLSALVPPKGKRRRLAAPSEPVVTVDGVRAPAEFLPKPKK